MPGRFGSVRGKDTVAVILALAIATAVNVITVAVLYDAIADPQNAGISENGTQILTTAFGGIIGVLGGFVGYARGMEAGRDSRAADDHDAALEAADPDAGADEPP